MSIDLASANAPFFVYETSLFPVIEIESAHIAPPYEYALKKFEQDAALFEKLTSSFADISTNSEPAAKRAPPEADAFSDDAFPSAEEALLSEKVSEEFLHINRTSF